MVHEEAGTGGREGSGGTKKKSRRMAGILFTIEQIELIRRLRASGITRDQVVLAFEQLDRLDGELGASPCPVMPALMARNRYSYGGVHGGGHGTGGPGGQGGPGGPGGQGGSGVEGVHGTGGHNGLLSSAARGFLMGREPPQVSGPLREAGFPENVCKRGR